MSQPGYQVQGHRAYQGYPYVDPYVTDAPSIDAVTAARWNDLPRRAVVPIGAAGGSRETPSSSGSPSKKDEDVPVVYIDLPESTGSNVTQSIDADEGPEFVQDTILYDPFENRRIDLPKDSTSLHSEGSGSTISIRQQPPPRPIPPNTLNLQQAGCSNPSTPDQYLPGYLQKEAQIYSPVDHSSYIHSPVDLGNYPEPPPAYTEVTSPAPITTQPQAHPPTQVIVNNIPQVTEVTPEFPNPNTRCILCQHCGIIGHTLVIRESGCVTHIIAGLFLCFCFPIAVLVYMTDWFKHLNHYCKNCNRIIGYQVPMCGTKFRYSNKHT